MVYGRLFVHVGAFMPLGISFELCLHALFYVAGHTILWAYLTSAWLLCGSCMDAVWPPSNARAKLSAWVDGIHWMQSWKRGPPLPYQTEFPNNLLLHGFQHYMRFHLVFTAFWGSEIFIQSFIFKLSLYLSFSAQRPYRAISSSISPQWVKEGWKWVEYDRTYPGGFVGTIWPHRNCHWGPQKWLSFAPEKKKEIGPEMLIWPKAVPAASNRLNKATNGLKMTAYMQSGTLGYFNPA